MKMIRTLLCILTVLALALPAAAAENTVSFADAFALAEQGIQTDFQEIPLLPEDCSGYEIRFRDDVAELAQVLTLPADPDRRENGMCIYALTEEDIRWFMDQARIFSRGPDGALFLVACDLPLVLRGKTLTVMWKAADRGTPDENRTLSQALNNRLRYQPDFIRGTVRWSPDGRYLFLNEPDAWFGVQMQTDDPYLWDTVTGEIFLLETSPKGMVVQLRSVLGGCFSRDGQYFYYLLNVMDSDIHRAVMRYDLEAGTLETVLESESQLSDLCEMGDSRLLLLDSGEENQLLRVSITETETVVEKEPLQLGFTTALFSVSEDLAFLTMSYVDAFTLLLPIRWDGTGSWLKLQDLSSDELTSLSASEAYDAAVNGGRYFRGDGNTVRIIRGSVPGFGNIHSIWAIDGTSLALMQAMINLPVTSNWPDRSHVVNAMILLDTETMKIRVILKTPRGGYYPYISKYDEVIYGQEFLGSNTLCSLRAEETPEESVEGSWTGFTQEGDYTAKAEGNDLILSPFFDTYPLSYTDLESTVVSAENGYRIQSVFTRFPEPEMKTYCVPEAFTEERFGKLTDKMSKKERKKLSNYYTLIKPDKLAQRSDAEELLASYPAFAAENMYILRDNLSAKSLEEAEQILLAAGYTAEEFDLDSASVAVPRGTNAVHVTGGDTPVPKESVSCVFPGGMTELTRSRALDLASLCDRINSAVYLKYLRSQTEAIPIASVIPETVEMSGTIWRIALDSAEDDGEKLTLSIMAIPES